MSKINTDELFGMDAADITRKVMFEALQLVANMAESEVGEEPNAALEVLYIDKTHLESLQMRISSPHNRKRLKLTFGDHLLLYTCFYLFTKFYSDELTRQMLAGMDDMDRMHLDEPEILRLRTYREEMIRVMNESKQRFSSFPLFTKHVETLEITFPMMTE